MKNIEGRIKKLEQRPEASSPPVMIVYVHDAKSEAEAAEAAKRGDTIIEYVPAREKAIAAYKAEHPEWEPSPRDWYISVVSEDCKRNVEQLIRGENPRLNGNIRGQRDEELKR